MEQTQSTAALSDQSPDWHSSTPPSPPPYIDPALIPDRDLLARYGNFEHRVWLTWYSMQMHMEPTKHRASWLAIIEGTDPHGDLWLWEDGDEKWAEGLCATYHGHSTRPIPCPTQDQADAFRALEARIRNSRPPAQNVLAHLSPQARVAVISWFIVAGPLRQSKLKSGESRVLDFATLLEAWGEIFRGIDRGIRSDHCIGSSHILAIWAEVMPQIYSIEDLMSIPWPYSCNCFESQLTTTSVKPQMPLEEDSVALHILYGLVCSPWSLILWVAFRTIRSEADPLPAFLEILSKDSSHAEIFAWDNKDDVELTQRVDWPSAIHPESWGQYMLEIPPKDWLLIRNLTRTPSRSSRRSSTSHVDDLSIRLAALFLTYSTSTFIALDIVLAPLPSLFRCLIMHCVLSLSTAQIIGNHDDTFEKFTTMSPDDPGEPASAGDLNTVWKKDVHKLGSATCPKCGALIKYGTSSLRTPQNNFSNPM
ncbi:hypothetical protein C8R44DRAFT_855916 [Mycena epipterygia]|nr:hypothetical protein C8R44DRAFT_855916 [Mycena epipterygia]